MKSLKQDCQEQHDNLFTFSLQSLCNVYMFYLLVLSQKNLVQNVLYINMVAPVKL